MKVVIAYDGSSYADAAIDDLARAGFPRDSEVVVASVADFSASKPVLSEFDLVSAASRRVEAALENARHHEARVMEDTRSMVQGVANRISEKFPEWKVGSEVLRGDPAVALMEKVREWRPDLIIGGAQGRSTIGRFFLGSVSKSVSERVSTSVRVVRRGFEKDVNEPIEIIVAAKNPAEAERIAASVGRRVWPEGARIRLIAVDEGFASGQVAAYCPDGKSIYQTAAESLAVLGLKVSLQIETGDPKAVFLSTADAWRADAIHVCSGRLNDEGLDEIASSLISTAKCTVEIVR